MEVVNAKEFNKNPSLEQMVEPDNHLKNFLVEYVGEKYNPEDQEVTVEMIVETMAAEFPEFLLAVAEENWIRGYQQAIGDVDIGLREVERQKNEQEDNQSHTGE
tara:strand:- start:116 stop:427 length:312 start_codon:yes stop_codon:yes gene_type:complete